MGFFSWAISIAVCLFQGEGMALSSSKKQQPRHIMPTTSEILHGIFGGEFNRFCRLFLVGGFNRPEKYARQIWSFPQGFGWKQKILETTTQLLTQINTPERLTSSNVKLWWFPIPSSVHLHYSRCHEKRWSMLNFGRVNDQSITCGGNLFKYYIGQIYAPQNQVKSFTQNPLRFFCCHSTTELLHGNLVDSMRLSNLPVFFRKH